MQLPFLKQKKWPRIAAPQEEKTVNGSYNDNLMEHMGKELMDAHEAKDPRKLRGAIGALARHFKQEMTDASE